MEPDARWERVKEIFGRLQDADAADRPSMLEAACGGDRDLHREVASLLDWDGKSDTFLDPGALGAAEVVDAAAHEPPEFDPLIGQTVGAYRVIGRIAQGGMGTVYRAARADQAFEKTVALKVIKRGMDTDHIVRRFEQERRALAALDHPHIARLIDGGTSADGRPYFIMELVEGVPITTYCDQRHAPIDQRLRLFREVCAAVAYAHRNLIVHRDIKPENVLVTGDGVPKLLDFGIAKLLEDDRGGTVDAALQPMTPAYASPEQRRGEPVTTATDVFSLGVTLRQLLSGQPPSGAEDAPSDEAIARARRTTPRQLQRRLQGDLDTIVHKALRPEPDRRYLSVEQLSEDIRRHLEGRTVLARPDGTWYRASKFLRRHRPAVATAAAVLVLVVAGVVGIAWQARVAARERNEARIQAARAERVSMMMGDILQSPDPLLRGRDVRVVDLLDEASRRLDRELDAELQVRAALLQTIGRTFLSIGVIDKAEAHVRRALDLRRADAQAGKADLAGAYADLGTVIRTKGDLAAAEAPMRQALALYREAYGEEHPAIAAVLNDLGGLLQERGELDAAEQTQRESLAMRRGLLGERHRDVADSLNDLGVVVGTRGDFSGAEPLHREALEIARAVEGPRHPDVASTMMTLAFVREMNGDPVEAEQLYREALDIRREVLGNAHPDTAWTLYSYGSFLRARGDHDQAVPLLSEVLALRGKTLPDSHRMIGSALYELGRSLQAQGRLPAAEAALRDCVAIRRAALGKGNWAVHSAESSLGEVLDLQGQPAETRLVESYEQLNRLLGAAHSVTRDALDRVVRHYERTGRASEAARFNARRPPPTP